VVMGTERLKKVEEDILEKNPKVTRPAFVVVRMISSSS
jgi:hypothetical protein